MQVDLFILRIKVENIRYEGWKLKILKKIELIEYDRVQKKGKSEIISHLAMQKSVNI